MQDTTEYSFDALDQTLQSAGASSSAAEAHGLLCGIVCAGGKAEPGVWLDHLLGEENTLSAAAQSTSDLLLKIHAGILQEFNDDELGFGLLLPVDESPLSLRTEALSHWCEGYLYGLALGGFRDDVEMSAEIKEVMKDFYEISHARFAYEVTDDTDEAAYMEIVEYVRMSVLLLYVELQPMPATARLQ